MKKKSVEKVVKVEQGKCKSDKFRVFCNPIMIGLSVVSMLCCVYLAFALIQQRSINEKQNEWITQTINKYKNTLSLPLTAEEKNSLQNLGITSGTKLVSMSIDTVHKALLVKYE